MAVSHLISEMLEDSPTAFWPLTESSGTVANDLSGNSRNLSLDLISGSAGLASVQVVPEGYVWDPTSYAYWYRAYQSWMNPGTGDWLVTMFFKGSAINPLGDSFETLYSLDQGDTGNGTIIYVCSQGSGLYPRGTVRVWYAGSVLQNSILLQGGVSLVDGNTHQIWVEKRSGTLSIYVDGVLGQSGTVGTPSSMSGSLYCGTAYSGSANYRQQNASGFVGLWVGSIPPLTRRADYYEAAFHVDDPLWMGYGSNSAMVMG